VRVVLGSPSIREGVSLKHIQHTHLLDPVWNQSSLDQIEGRAIRHCSHVQIAPNDPVLKRKVVVHLYKLCAPPNSRIRPRPREQPQTCDEVIYDRIIPAKDALIKRCEALLRSIAIDRLIFGKVPLVINLT
jgi:hypothetical protein